MSRHAHPAFPSFPASSSAPSTSPIPATPTQLLDLINSCNNLQSIRDHLIPILNQVAEGKGQAGVTANAKDKASRGEELLSLADDALYGLDDGRVKASTAALVYIISARFNRRRYQRNQQEELLVFASRLCNIGDESQLELCGARISNLAWGLLRFTQQFNKPEMAIQPLFTLINRSMRPGVLSGAHAALLEACLLARRYDHAVPLIEEVYTDVRSAKPSYLDVITFHHHAGLVSAADKQFMKAVEYFSAAVAVPTQTASAIQLASAKRAILCELLVTGKLLHFPKYTSGAVNRIVERNAQEYTKLAKAFEARDWAAVEGVTGKAEFKDDCNAGLIRRVIESVTKRRILRLRETYSRLRIDHLAAKVGKPGSEGVARIRTLLDEMIATHAIGASISSPSDSSPALVVFHDDNAYSASTDTLKTVADVNHMAKWLGDHLSHHNKEMGISSAYLKKQANLLDLSGGKGGEKNGKTDDFDAMMAAEETGVRGKKSGVGADYGDMGY